MLKNITELGPREAQFIAQMASRPTKLFTVYDAVNFWGKSDIARKKLSILEKKGWLARIERGKYMVIPLEAGLERNWSESPMLIASVLAKPACVAYWSALRYWNWTEQIPRIIYIQTTQRKSSSRKTIIGNIFEIVTVSEKKFFGCKKQWQESISFFVTDKEKTLIDCADDMKRGGGIEELVKAVKSSVSEIDFNKLDHYVQRFPNGAVKKRLGYLFESVGPNLSNEGLTVLENWKQQLTAGISPLYPSGPKTGKIVTRWRLLVNVRI